MSLTPAELKAQAEELAAQPITDEEISRASTLRGRINQIETELRQVSGCYAAMYGMLLDADLSYIEGIAQNMTGNEFVALAESVQSGMTRLHVLIDEHYAEARS